MIVRSTAWREYFKGFKSRVLDGNKVILGAMDALVGLEKVFIEEFPYAKSSTAWFMWQERASQGSKKQSETG